MLVNRFKTSPNYLFPQKRSFHMTDESNFTVVGNRPTLENWELLKLNMLAPPVKAVCPVYLFLLYISANFCCKSAILIGQRWKTGSYSSYACFTCKCNMPYRLFSVVYHCKPLPYECNIALVVTSL